MKNMLRIFYASSNSPNEYIQSTLWRSNLLLALRDIGHDVYEFDYDWGNTFKNLEKTDPIQNEFIRKNRPLITQTLLEQLKEQHQIKPFDIFFSYFYDACITPEGIDTIRSMGIKTINWYCNGSYQLHLVEEISPHYDYCLVPEEFRLEDYRKMGANPIYFQEAANPNIYMPYPIESDFDVTFVGQNYGNRAEYIRYLYENKISVMVYGPGWQPKIKDQRSLFESGKNFLSRVSSGGFSEIKKIPHLFKVDAEKKVSPIICGGVLPDKEMVKLFSRSKINLGFSFVGETYKKNQPIQQIRLRDFEIPMSGGFYLAEYLPELENFFDIGKEIICFTGKEDLLAKVRYYLSHTEERDAIRIAGYHRARRDHTWQKRFSDLFTYLEI